MFRGVKVAKIPPPNTIEWGFLCILIYFLLIDWYCKYFINFVFIINFVLLLYNKYSLSQRNNSTLLILPHRSKQFTYISSRIWNAGMKHIANDVCMTDIKLGPFKRKLKTCLLEIQGRHDKIEWYPLNFKLDSLYTQ